MEALFCKEMKAYLSTCMIYPWSETLELPGRVTRTQLMVKKSHNFNFVCACQKDSYFALKFLSIT